ncbi:MAG: hypothetical protein KC731_12150, partial [Myxococcales bacterium]|nr:hypothetical protein [Myxococcales bacterium]
MRLGWMSGLHFLALALLACAPVVGPSPTSPQQSAPPPPPPVATAGETIELPPAPPATTATGPARVLHHSPEGAADFSSEIAVLFDGPVRPLGLAPNDPPITATISPQVAGRWSWVGTDAIRFEPREPLPGATRFEVSIPRELPALPGRAMAEPHRFAFETPRPRVVAATPDADLESDYRYPQERDVAFELSFNQKVDRAVADHLSLTATTTSGERSLRFRVDVSDGARKVVVVPSAPLPPGATVVLKADEGLTGSEGPMPMGVSFTHAIAVKGPIRPVAARCTPSHFDAELCDPRGPIRLYFSGDAPYSYEGLDFVRTQPAKKSWGQDSGIEGGRGFVDVTLSDVAAGESLELTVEAPPGKRIDNAWEEPLVGALRTRLRFGRPRPSLDLWGSGVHHPASSPLAMVLSATNVELIRVRAARPTREQILAMVREPEVPPALHFGAMRSLATPRPDEDVQHQVALSDLVGDARGPVVVEVLHREPGPNGEVEQRTRKAVQLTELGVHTTLLHRHVLVWVTGLTSGAALAKAEVEVRRLDGAVVGRGVTGKDGTVRLPLAATAGGEGDEGERYVVFVRRGDDFAYHEARRPPRGGTLGIAYSDRGLYRPGETVELAGVIRVPGAGASLETPRGKRGQLVVRDPHGRVFRRLELSTSTFGTWHRSLVLSEAAVRGIYRVEVWLGGPEDRPPHVVPGRFVVADYEPTPFTVDATILPLRSPPVVRGEDIRCVATGRYLHGSPMAGATAALEIRRERETFAPEGLRLFHTTLERRPEPPRRHARGAGTLDGEGRFEHRVTLDLPEMTGPERVRCEILGSDLDGRALEAQDSVIVHPASAYVGIRVEQEVFRGKPFTVQVRATDIAGTNLSLPVDVVVERFEEREGEVEREVVGRCHVATSEATAHCDFEAPDRPYAAADEGLEIRATSADPEGRPIAASFSIYPEPEPEHTTPSPSPPQPIGRSFTLSGEVFDRPVTPGEVMRVWISSPWIKDGEVQLTAFRDDVIWRKRLRLPPRGAIVDIPITDAMVPTVALHAVAVSGSKGASDEREIEVSSASRELKVSLTPSATEVLPGAPLDIDLVVKDAAGRPVQAEVTLYAADVATLYLAQYRRPDPMRIYASRWIRYDDYDSREHLFDPRRSHRSRPPRVRMGASHVSFDVRGDFRQTAFYLPHLVTGSDGRLRRRVTLPDGLTTYRIFAVAVTAGEQVGGAEAEVQTNKPVMLQPSVPRVLRSGDRTAIHATLQGEARGPVTVTVEAGGALRLRGETKKTVRLSGPEAIGVTFEAEATAAGPYQVLFAASAPGGEDRVVARGEVVAPTLTETADLSGVTDRAVLEQL